MGLDWRCPVCGAVYYNQGLASRCHSVPVSEVLEVEEYELEEEYDRLE